jgi:FkbM family methyltransferase
MEVEELIAACYERLPSVHHAMDLGANAGFHTRRLAQLPAIQRVLAVEANPRHFAALEYVAKTFEPVQLALVAVVSQVTGSATLKVSEEFHGRGGIKGLHIWDLIDPTIEFNEIEVPAKTLDELIVDEMEGHVDFIKFDLEGSELDLMLNSEGLFRHRPVCVMENSVHAPRLAGITPEYWVQFVRSKNCALIDFDLNEIHTADALHQFNHAWLVPTEKAEPFLSAARSVYDKFPPL